MSNKKQMSRKKTSKKRKMSQKKSMLMVLILVMALAVFLGAKGYRLHQKEVALQQQEQELQKQIDQENSRSEEIDELQEYVGTDEYVEDVAKDRLGLVKEGETILKEK